MNPSGPATQIYSPQFDRRFFDLPQDIQKRTQQRIDELGLNLRGFSHYRMQGVDAFRLRVVIIALFINSAWRKMNCI